jgi:hypothetical protein
MVLLFQLALSACGEGRRTGAVPNDTTPIAADTTARRAAARAGIRFNPGALRPGERVGTLVAETVEARRAVVDSTYVGMARFRGRLELSGSTLRHPDADARDVEICFEADSTSAARLPRWSGDERRPWFCFVNHSDAKSALGPPSDGVRATILIEDFTIQRGLSDEVNSARLVRVIRRRAAMSQPSR